MPAVVWIVAGCAVVLHRLHRRRKGKDLHKIPLAPGSIPILGHVGVIKAYSTNALHKVYGKYAEAAGEAGVVRMCIAGDMKLLCTTPAAFAAVLRSRAFLPKPGGLYNVFLMFGIKVHSLFTTQDGAEHARVRKHMMRFFNADNVAATIGQLEAQVASATAAISSAAAAGAPAGAASATGAASREMGVSMDDVTADGILVNIFEFAACNIIQVVFKVFFEVDRMPPLDVFNAIMAAAHAVSAHPAQYQLLKRGLYPGSRRHRRNFDALYAFHCELVREIYAKPPPGDSTAFWAAVRNAFPDAMTDPAQHEAAIANAAFVYGAGYETTANAVRHTLAALAIDQDSQAALAEELREAGLLATAEAPTPPAITAEQLAGLTVLDAVCHESLRLFPPAPSGGVRVLEKDTTISGYRVPSGTTVMFPTWALHHNRHVWGPDALLWRPDRWLQSNSVAAVKKDGAGNLRFQPFLDGASNCIAQHLALVEMKLMVAMVISRLHVALDPQRLGHLRTVEDYAAATATRLTLQAAEPTCLRMRPRAAGP